MRGLPSGPYLTDGARERARAAIRAADGCEVFFLGRAEDGLVHEVEDFCRGNDHMVPVLRRVARGYDVAIHNHPGGDLTPSDPDLHVAAELGDLGLAFYIVDNDVERVNPVVRLIARPPPPPPIDRGALASVFGPDGPIARRLGDGFEARPEQVRMAEAVASAFEDAEVHAIEAGTGTGKSLAYLVPALIRAVLSRQRVVVSTATINLQEQLVRKDIPLVLQAWPEIAAKAGLPPAPPRAMLLKGRANYLCLRKVEDFERAPDQLFDDEGERAEILGLCSFARRTLEGSREELPTVPPRGTFEKVACEADACNRTACAHYERCFYFKARRLAHEADLLVVNHHLLFSDIAARRTLGWTASAVLPPYRHLVLDEAHHLEDVASEHLGERVTGFGLRLLLGRLRASARSGRGERGLLPALRARLEPAAVLGGEAVALALRAIEEQALPARAAADLPLDAFVEAAARLVETGAREGEEPAPAGGDERDPGPAPTALRLRAEVAGRPEWREFARAGVELARALDHVHAALGPVLEALGDVPDGLRDDVGSLAIDLRALAGRVEAAAGTVSSFCEAPPAGVADAAGLVRWVERRREAPGGSSPQVTLQAAPLEVARSLARDVYPSLGGIVLTSATLAVSRTFDYLAVRTGLDRLDPPERFRTLALASPFDYASQVVLAVPQDLPEPGAPGHERALETALLEAARASGGRAFFLFTSYALLGRMHGRLERPLRALGLTPLRQGETTRRRLVERFRAEAPAVLFATDSFWEGVDVRGGALRLVAIVKLPFRVPTEPLQQARAEAVEASGRSPFRALTVPQAVLKLKQGFGRLVRSKQDRGAILLLDPRVVARSYGRAFLESLPPARRAIGRLREVLREVEKACR